MHFPRDKFKGVTGLDFRLSPDSFLKDYFPLLAKFPAQTLGRTSQTSEGSLSVEKPDFQQQHKPDFFALKETGEKGQGGVQKHCFVSLEWG